MSTQNHISITIPDETIAEITNHLQQCKTLLAPFLQALTTEERASLFKMGDKTLATVLKTKDYVETNPEFIPGYMDKDEFFRDATVVNQLNPICNIAIQLASDLQDTITLAGSDSLQEALLYYGHVKEASSRGIVSAKPIYEDLSQRFIKRTKRTTQQNN